MPAVAPDFAQSSRSHQKSRLAAPSSVLEFLKRANFYDYKDQFKTLLKLGARGMKAAGSEQPGAFSRDNSHVPLASVDVARGTKSLLIDVGGSHVRISLRVVDGDGQTALVPLADIPHKESRLSSKKGFDGDPLQRFASYLAHRGYEKLEERRIKTSEINGVAVIWSNAMKCAPIEGTGIKGVTGTVTDREGSYRKNEWFIGKLQNGDDIGAALLGALGKKGIAPEVFLLLNDTTATAKAYGGLDKVDGAGIASTGANETDVIDGKIVSTEAGAKFRLPMPGCGVLTLPDLLASPEGALEDFIAGKGMPLVFTEHILHMGQSGFKPFEKLAVKISKLNERRRLQLFNGLDLSKLDENDLGGFLQGKPEWMRQAIAAEDLPHLKDLAQAIVARGGFLCGLMCSLSIANKPGVLHAQQGGEKPSFTIILDSAQARTKPSYLKAMQDAVVLHLSHVNLKIIVLEPPEDGVSIPIIGAGRALDNFYANDPGVRRES